MGAVHAAWRALLSMPNVHNASGMAHSRAAAAAAAGGAPAVERALSQHGGPHAGAGHSQGHKRSQAPVEVARAVPQGPVDAAAGCGAGWGQGREG